MNYFRARRAVSLFVEYRRKALLYWLLFTVPGQDEAADEIIAIRGEVNDKSPEELTALRLAISRRLNELAPTLHAYAAEMKVSTKVTVRVPAVAGGGQVSIDILDNLTDRDPDNWILPGPGRSLMIIDGCVGAAKLAERDGLIRLLVPLYWLVDIPALIMRWPLLILEQAGMPEHMEGTWWAWLLKVGFLILQVAVVLVLVAKHLSSDVISAVLKGK